MQFNDLVGKIEAEKSSHLLQLASCGGLCYFLSNGAVKKYERRKKGQQQYRCDATIFELPSLNVVRLLLHSLFSYLTFWLSGKVVGVWIKFSEQKMMNDLL